MYLLSKYSSHKRYKIFFFLFYSPLFPFGEIELKESGGGLPVAHSLIGEKCYMIGTKIQLKILT